MSEQLAGGSIGSLGEPKSLVELMDERGLTVRQVADAIGVSMGTVTAWRSRYQKPSALGYRALLMFLGISEHELDLEQYEPTEYQRQRVGEAQRKRWGSDLPINDGGRRLVTISGKK